MIPFPMTFTELEQAEALKFLYKWLQNHPKYGVLTPPEQVDSLHYANVSTPDNHLKVLVAILSKLTPEMRETLQFLSVTTIMRNSLDWSSNDVNNHPFNFLIWVASEK